MHHRRGRGRSRRFRRKESNQLGCLYIFIRGKHRHTDEARRAGYLSPRPGAFCKSCEFWATTEQLAKGIRDGWSECLTEGYEIPPADQSTGTILDLHDFRRFNAFVDAGHILLRTVEESDFANLSDDAQISLSQRQWLQCLEARGDQVEPFVLKQILSAELKAARYLLHFIDFETCRPALPLHGRRRPYEQILFQFSHHELKESGELCHAHDHLYAPDGNFPNYVTIRALRDAVGDTGTVVHWWDHERNVLSEVRTQLQNDTNSPSDVAELIAFIDSLIGNDELPGRPFDLGKATKIMCSFRTHAEAVR